MIDDAFLRQTAALQANLKMLECQQDALSDFQDMQALRIYKARLFDYIESHSKAGHLPPDPFQVIQQRIVAVSDFFTAAFKQYQQLKSWKKDWINGVPPVTIADLHSASMELEELVAETPRIQQELNAMLSPLDWDFSTDLPDLHAELVACAQAVDDADQLTHIAAGGIYLPGHGLFDLSQGPRRRGLYQFAHGEGDLFEEVTHYLASMRARIQELISLHEDHSTAVAEAEQLLTNHNFRSAAAILKKIKKGFADIPYAAANKQLKELFAKHHEIEKLNKPIVENASKAELKKLSDEIYRLRSYVTYPESEFGCECNELLNIINQNLNSLRAQRKREKLYALSTVVIIVFIALIFSLYLYDLSKIARQEEALNEAKLEIERVEATIAREKAEREAAEAKAKAEREAAEAKAKAEREAAEAKAKAEREAAEAKAKAEREAAEAKAKAEREAAEAKAKAEAAWAKSSGKLAGEEKVIEIAPGVAMTFCWIPPGKFTMGSPANEKGRSSDENQVEVTLTKGFWMAKTEVTQAQWKAVMGNNPSNFKGANLPVEKVSWNDVQEFLTKINEMVGNADGRKMVLPTEAQWEYAARAGETGPYSGGAVGEVTWYDANSASKTHPVGTKKPNVGGLHDMHGNVWEWCADWYASELQGGVDPQGPNSGTNRVGRGGSWRSDAFYCRVANRGYYGPSYSDYGLGFRVARSSVP